jgi:hypothetical protein
MPPGVQRYKRIKMVLPVRFWAHDEHGPNAGPQLASRSTYVSWSSETRDDPAGFY